MCARILAGIKSASSIKKPPFIWEVAMAVKILIKRSLPLDKAKAQHIVSIFRQLRMLALEQEGYISSETLRSM
jgi:hypothetical protein